MSAELHNEHSHSISALRLDLADIEARIDVISRKLQPIEEASYEARNVARQTEFVMVILSVLMVCAGVILFLTLSPT